MKKWHLIIDVEKCENCRNCFLACKDEHVDNEWPGYAAPQAGEGESWIRVAAKERGQFPFIDVAYLPTPCQHCDDAPCVKAGRDGAVRKRDDGIVLVDPAKARGQKQIAAACPYDAIQWNEGLQLPQKCTLCAHLLDEGWTKTRCVQACPTGALTMRHADGEEMARIIESERLEVLRPALNTRPGAYYSHLHRFTRCFIGGSVATRVDAQEDCVAGAKVTLSRAKAPMAETITDEFGDFKFDNLEEESGPYTVSITHAGHETKSIEVDLKKSAYLGVILM